MYVCFQCSGWTKIYLIFSFELLDADAARVFTLVMDENIELFWEASGIVEKIYENVMFVMVLWLY